MNIAAIMPCRGRVAQTVTNVRRLLATTGCDGLTLMCIGCKEETEVLRAVQLVEQSDSRLIAVWGREQRLTYWQALREALLWVSPHAMIATLANDLWACDDWLKEGVAEYRAHFGDGDGLLGFAGDGHGPQHSCHFLISRALLDRYGGWPVWYSHNFGDRELCARAQADGLYAKAERAELEHCHPGRGLAEDDAVYQAGRATYRQDEALFTERRRAGWPPFEG